ncbi:unnamed protein product [Brachionus calyciflorus]|uniref:Uncharacterized protein n=1 Tax=Brachionus calyciflorus TaxID=104777 RepID=A0A814JHT8_9BILA|nr:unnamed protein product [Brachionus calyciflorus]
MDFKDLLLMDPLQLIQYLMRIGLLLPNRTCPKCNREMVLKKRAKYVDGASWRCSSCRSFNTIRTGSFFEKLRLLIMLLLEIVEFWAKERKQIDIEESLHVSRPT